MALRTNIETAMARMYTDNPANETLQIASHPTINQDTGGTVHFVSEVLNKGSEPASFVKIIATLYDLNNRVIGTQYTYTNPSTILPGQAAPFDLTVGPGDNIPIAHIDHVKFHLDRTGRDAILSGGNSMTNNSNIFAETGAKLRSLFGG